MRKGNKGQKEEISMSLPVKDLAREYYASGFPKVLVRGKYDMQISARLKEARTLRKYSLAQVRDALKKRGIETGRSTIQGYEVDEDNANHRYPSLHMLLNIANVYDCSLDYVFGVSDEINRPTSDLRQMLLHNDTLNWNGKEISQEERAMICRKVEQIMAL